MFRNLFYAIFFIGLLYTASCMYSCYKVIVPDQPESGRQRLKLRSERIAPSGKFDLTPPTTPLPDPDLSTLEFTSRDALEDPGLAGVFYYEEPLSPLTEVLCAPGLLLLRAFGFEPESELTWLLVILTCWEVWAVGLRLSWIIPARYFGWGYSPRAFRYWQWLGIPWQPLCAALQPGIHWLRLLRIGKADTDRFAGYFQRAICTFKPGQILLGRQSFWYLPCLQPLGVTTERGVTIVAAPGSGKTSWLISHLSMYPGNFAVVDCDGSIHDAIGDHLRRQGKQTIVLAPLAGESDRFNLLAEVMQAMQRYGDEAAVEFAAVLAEGLIKETHGQNEWVAQDARAFLKSLILYVCRYARPEQRNLVYLRRLLILGQQSGLRPQDDPFLSLLADMRLKPDWDGAIASGAEMMRRSFSQSDGRSIPLSYCIEQTQCFDMPPLARMSRHSDFECLDLKAGKGICIFLVLPLQAMSGPLAGWVRAFFTQTIYAFQRDTHHRPHHPTALCVDEAGLVKIDTKLASLAIAGLRKFGLVYYSIFQSVTQMEDAASDYLGLSEVNIFMTTNDQATLNYLSQTLGTSTNTERVQGNWPFGIEPRNQKENRRLASPGQLKLLLKDNVIVTRADAAMILKPIRHYIECPVSWLTPHSFYGETAARAFTRRVLAFFTGRKALPPARPANRIHGKKEDSL